MRKGEVDILGQYFSLGLVSGAITQKGAWYSAGDERLGQGIIKAKEGLAENPKLCQEIWKAACLQELGRVV